MKTKLNFSAKVLLLALLTFNFYLLPFTCSAQIAVNSTGANPDGSAGLDVSFTDKGVLIPRLTLAQRGAIASPATSLLIYQTDNTPGYYYYDGSAWQLLGRYVAGSGISIVGNVISNTAPSSGGTVTSVTGTLPIAVATGTTTPVISITGLSTLGAANQVPGVNASATGWEYKTLTSGAGISITNAAGSITLTNTAPSSGGTVTSITQGTGMSFSSNPITGTGTINLFVPVSIANGGTNITTIGGAGSVIYSNGAQHASTAVGTAGNILTSTGAGAPTWNTLASLGAVSSSCGTNNTIPKMTSATTMVCSQIVDDGTTVWMNTGTTPTGNGKLNVSSATTTAGDFAIKGAVTASSGQVYGVYGLNTASTTSDASGVLGYDANASGVTNGVWGYSISSAGTGVYGLASNAAGDGIIAYNSATAGTNTGSGITAITSQGGNGTYQSAAAWGLNYNTAPTAGCGVAGYIGASANAHGFNKAGVSGGADQNLSGGTGVVGSCDNATGIGVQGQSAGSGGVGVFGVSSANGNSGSGVNGQNSSTNTTGGDAVGVYGYTAVTSITTYLAAAVYGYTTQANTPNYDAFYGNGNVVATGTKSALVQTSKGPTLLYCVESPEVWFEDYGSGKLDSGYTKISLDKLFLETVTINDKYPMKVFVQLEGSCEGGVYVTKKDTYFEVYQQGNKNSNAEFSYRILAKRKGNEDTRLEISKPVQNIAPKEMLKPVSAPVLEKPTVMNESKKEFKDKPTENKK
jgi:hypothetical protein